MAAPASLAAGQAAAALPVSPPSPGRFRILLQATRPHTLPLSLSPVLVGSVVGWAESGMPRLDITLAAAVSTACMQIGANLQNDAADALNGTDQADRLGPVRVTQQGWVSPERMFLAARLCFALAVVSGVWLVLAGGWPLVLLGLMAVIAAWAYSGGPVPISRGPFGEFVVLVFFGFIAVAGVAWLYSGRVSAAALLAGLVVGLPAAAVLTINNLRDHATDRRAGRRTLAILLGPRRAAGLIDGLRLGTLPALLVLASLGLPWSGGLLALAMLPLGLVLRRALRQAKGGDDYNRQLKMTTLFQLLLSTLLALGIVIGTGLSP